MKVTSIKTKIIVMMTAISMLSIALVGSYFIYSLVQQNKAETASYRELLVAQFDREFKTQVETAVSLIDTIHKQQQKGLLTEEQAKKQAADLVRELRYDGQAGYFWIDTTEGVNVVLLGREAEGKSRINSVDPNGVYFIKDLLKNGMQEGGGYSVYAFPKPGKTEPLPKKAYTVLYKPYQWVIGTGAWIDSVDTMTAEKATLAEAKLHKDIITALAIMLVIELLVVVLAVYMGRNFAIPIIAVTNCLERFAQGDFSLVQTGQAVNRQDELGIMAKAVERVSEIMRGLVLGIANSSNQVTESSAVLLENSKQSAEVSSQVANSITQVAASANSQFDAVNSASSTMSELSASIEEVAANASMSAEQANKAVDVAHKGNQNIDAAIRQMNTIEMAVNRSAAVIGKLGDRSKEIGIIVDTIAGIAGQTNLLALNAAIEAARAGEQGRGFAVVAEEVRKLAEQSQEAAKQIANLIQAIQSDTDNAVQAMQTGTEEVKSGTQVVRNSGEAFQNIADLVEQVAEQSKSIATTIHEMATGTQDITVGIQNIDHMSKKVADESENVSAASEELTASMHEMMHSGQTLADMAQNLQTQVKQLKI